MENSWCEDEEYNLIFSQPHVVAFAPSENHVNINQSEFSSISTNSENESCDESKNSDNFNESNEDIQSFNDGTNSDGILNKEDRTSLHSENSKKQHNFLVRNNVKRINEEKKRTRKRKTEISRWNDVKAKKARNKGEVGLSRNKKLIKSRKVGVGCDSKCRFKCQTRISAEDRTKVFQAFWNLGDHSRQWDLISQWVNRSSPKSLQTDNGESEHKGSASNSRKKNIVHTFNLPASNGMVKVCKKMFLHTLDISFTWIRTTDKKVNSDVVLSIGFSDNRGKHGNRPFKVPANVKESALKHIRSFPTMESHYCRENSTKLYLEEGLNLCKMYRMYLEEMQKGDKNEAVVSKQMYERLFNTEFNYSFFKPKKDRCEQCVAFENLNETEKLEKNTSHTEHLTNKDKARELMRCDTERSKVDSSVCAINFDLQKVLTTPRAEIGPLYYMSKLSVFNFTIFNMGDHSGVCNVWNETVASRGSNEIGSLLYKYFLEQNDAGKKNFVLYSDNCGGQNRNKNVFTMYVKASQDLEINITHRFLETGHTQSSGDSMHSCIERKCSSKSVYSQDQWCELMQQAKVNNPYRVNQIMQEDIYEFSQLATFFDWNKIKIRSIKEISVRSSDSSVYIKLNYDEEPKRLNILKHGRTIADVQNYALKSAYEQRIKLNEKKKKDLRTMVSKKWIPDQYVPFYNEIFEHC